MNPWIEFNQKVGKGLTPTELIGTTLWAFKKVYGPDYLNSLVDPTTLQAWVLVDNMPKNPTNNLRLAEFITHSRKTIYQHGMSEFTELAIKSLWQALFQPGESRQQFSIFYLYHLIDYALTRQLVPLFGTPGLVNFYSLDNTLKEVLEVIKAQAVSFSLSSPRELIKSFITN